MKVFLDHLDVCAQCRTSPFDLCAEGSGKLLLTPHEVVLDFPLVPPSFAIVEDGNAIMCCKCGMISSSKDDIEHRFCGKCHSFH